VRFALATVTAAGLLAAAPSPAAADEGEAPSAALLVGGVAVAAAGGALQYYAARRYTNNLDAGFGWVALDGVGGLVTQGGGALVALWGWRLGEHDLAVDLASGGPIKQRRPLANTGLVLGGAALLASYVALVYADAGVIGCVRSQNQTQLQSCARDRFMTLTTIELVADGVLLVAAPIAGYGFGYDSAAQKATERRTAVRFALAPAFIPGGAGLSLRARF
jgi:hypothetical protein